jgi:hypothetical protein
VDWLTFLAALVKALAWPVSVIILATLLRGPIAGLLSRVSRMRIKHGDWEVESELEAIHRIAETNLPVSEDATPSKSTPVSDLASISPNTAVALAWVNVERALIETARRNNMLREEEPATQNPVYIARALLIKGKIDEVTYAIFAMLNQVRNTAVHSTEPRFTTSAAIEFGHLTSRFVAKLFSL